MSIFRSSAVRGATQYVPPSPASANGYSQGTVYRSSLLRGRGPLRRVRVVFVVIGAVLVAVVVVVSLAFAQRGGIGASGSGLATVALPFGGGRIVRFAVYSGPHEQRLPAQLKGGTIWPRGSVRAGERLTVEAVLKRSGWISWLTGSEEKVVAKVRVPEARLASQFLTVAPNRPLVVSFSRPVFLVRYGAST